MLPGHTLLWREGELTVSEYWDLHFSGEENADDDSDYVRQWTELFEESVRLRLMADVPLGMFLSGGIDSSAIAAVMSSMVSSPIKTFSVGFSESEANELEYARVSCKSLRHRPSRGGRYSSADFFSVLPKLIWHEDEPIAHPSSVPLYFVSKLASEHVKVVLTGEGSDELLGGYGRYRKTLMNIGLGKRYHKFAPRKLRLTLRDWITDLPYSSIQSKTESRSFLTLTPDLETIYFDNFAVFSRVHATQLLSAETSARVGSAATILRRSENCLRNTDADSLLDQLLYADTKTYLHELLMKQDQMSMAASIESRVPFLDHKLVEFTARLPERMKIRGRHNQIHPAREHERNSA